MARLETFHDAASVHVAAPPREVEQRLRRPDVLAHLDLHLEPGAPLPQVVEDEDVLEVRSPDGEVERTFRMRAEGDGTRLATVETVRPRNLLEATHHMLFPGRHHRDLEAELQRIRQALEGTS